MNTKNTKTSAVLKEEVKDEIEKVNHDLNQIQKRLTPGQIIDDAIYYPHGGNQQAVFQHLKQNPIGASFLTLGTLFLMEDEKLQSYEEVIKQKTGQSLDKLKSKYKNYEEVIKRGTGESLDSLKGKYLSTSGGVSKSVEKVKNLPPLSYVALGVGLGALSGASLPVSARENAVVGEKMGDQMSVFAEELKGAMHESAMLIKNEFVDLLKEFDLGLLMGST